MKVKEMMEKLDLKCLTKEDLQDREISCCYICDLLSWVMTKAKANSVWLTIQSNVNIVAVASLTDCACVVICEDVEIDPNTIQKANEQDVILLKTNHTSYELACKLSALI